MRLVDADTHKSLLCAQMHSSTDVMADKRVRGEIWATQCIGCTQRHLMNQLSKWEFSANH